MNDVFFELTSEQADAVEKAASVAERVWRGDFAVAADLAAEGLLCGRDGSRPADVEHVRGMLVVAVDYFRTAAGVPIFAGRAVGYDADNRSVSEERLPALCEALDLFTRIGLVQLGILDEVGREEVFSAAGSARDETQMDWAREAIGVASIAMGHSPRSSHSIGSPHLNIVFKRAYEVLKQARRHQAELSGSTELKTSVHGDGLVVRYTQDPAPSVSATPPAQKASLK